MPIYEYLCKNGHKCEGYNPMSRSSEPKICPSCYETAERIISAVRVFGDLPGYVSPASGKWVEGKKARLEDLRSTNCRPYEDGEREQAILRAAKADRELDKAVDEAVERVLPALDLSASDHRLHEQAKAIQNAP